MTPAAGIVQAGLAGTGDREQRPAAGIIAVNFITNQGGLSFFISLSVSDSFHLQLRLLCGADKRQHTWSRVSGAGGP